MIRCRTQTECKSERAARENEDEVKRGSGGSESRRVENRRGAKWCFYTPCLVLMSAPFLTILR